MIGERRPIWLSVDCERDVVEADKLPAGSLLAPASFAAARACWTRVWEPEFSEVDGENGLNFAGWAKKLTGLPTISVGSVGLDGDAMSAFRGESSKPTGLDALVHRLEREEFDLIAVGRALLADPLWVVKVRSGNLSELKGFSPDTLRELV